jgi:hypothetical protein
MLLKELTLLIKIEIEFTGFVVFDLILEFFTTN